jgi:hypothetical protein
MVSIRWGSIEIEVGIGGSKVRVFVDDIDDDLAELVQFVRALAANLDIRSRIADRRMTTFSVDACGEMELCNFAVVVGPNDRTAGTTAVTAIVSRAQLGSQLRNLATAIANHSQLAHHFVSHADLPNECYDRVGDEAKRTWERLVGTGELGAEDDETREEFIAAAITAKVPLPVECRRRVADIQRMLRSLGAAAGTRVPR